MRIDPIQTLGTQALGAEFRIPGLAELDPAGAAIGAEGASAVGGVGAAGGSSFGGMLNAQLDGLSQVVESASAQSQALAAGQVEDVSSVVMEVERASLSLQLATQMRNRAVEAYQDLWRMQI